MTAALIVLGLTAVTALYVAGEFAAVGVRRGRIRQLAEEGDATARWLLPILEDGTRLDRYIAACQIGITLSSLMLGAYSQSTLAEGLATLLDGWTGAGEMAAQSAASAVILVGLTAVQMILSEQVPKSIALQNPTGTALFTAKILRATMAVFSGLVTLLGASSTWVLRRLGVSRTRARHIHSPEEIDLLIAESRDGGLLEADEHIRLHRALRLGTRPVHQIRIPRTRMDAIDANDPIDEILAHLARSPYTRLPVYRGTKDEIIGILHTRDVALRFEASGTIDSIEGLIRPVLLVPESASVDRLLTLFRERRCRQAVVVDEHGGVDGIVTLEDVLTEVLGNDLGEERAEAEEVPERLGDGRVRLPGDLRLDRAEPYLGVLWEGLADTVGGHVAEVLGRLPVQGESVDVDGVRVFIERMEGNSVASIVAVPVPSQEEEPDGG